MAKFGEEVSSAEARAICDADGVVWDESGITHGKHHRCDVDDKNAMYLCAEWAPYYCLHDPREQGVDLAPLRELADQLLDPQTGGFGWADEAHRRAMTIAGEALAETLDSLPAALLDPQHLIGLEWVDAEGVPYRIRMGSGQDAGIVVIEARVCGEWSYADSCLGVAPLRPKPKRRPKPATLQDCPTDGTVFVARLSPDVPLRWHGPLLQVQDSSDGTWEPVLGMMLEVVQCTDFRLEDGTPVNGWEEDDV